MRGESFANRPQGRDVRQEILHTIWQAIPGFSGASTRVLSLGDFDSIKAAIDEERHPHTSGIVFLATPAEESMHLAPRFLELGLNVIDLSGAFRLPASVFEVSYKHAHTAPGLISKAFYGLHGSAPSGATAKTEHNPSLIANPGCYATGATLALLPLFSPLIENTPSVIDPHFVVVDAKSGYTGAGKKAREGLLFSEGYNDYLPYRMGNHQHEPEILQNLKSLAKNPPDAAFRLSFNTSLLPIARGISLSVYAKIHPSLRAIQPEQLYSHFNEFYQNNKLIEVFNLNHDGFESSIKLNRVVNTPYLRIGTHVEGDQIRIVCVFDNLLKGAASQAIENANQLLGLPHDFSLLPSTLSTQLKRNFQ